MADEPAVSKKTKHARWMLRESEKALRDVLKGFELMRRQMLEGDGTVLPADLSKARVVLGQTRSHLLDEVNKYERHILLSKGLIAEAPIDFEAIKDQIGSSLDRIRLAQDAEGVSERSDE